MDPEVEEFLSSRPNGGPLPADMESFRKMSSEIEAAEVERLGPPSSKVKEFCSSVPMRDGVENRCKVFQPSAVPPAGSPVIVLFHGGGFSVGSPDQYTLVGRALVEMFDCVCIAASYRLAPEHTFPMAALDTWDTIKFVAANAESCFEANPALGFVVGGASSGANLAAGVGQLAKDHGLSPPLTGQYLSLPLVLWEGIVPPKYVSAYESISENTQDPIQTVESLKAILKRYNPDIHSPYFSLLNSEPGSSGLPPAYIQVCGLHPIRNDGLIYNDILKENRVSTRLDVYSGFPHGWWLFMPKLKSSLNAAADIVKGIGWLLGREADDRKVFEYLRGKIELEVESVRILYRRRREIGVSWSRALKL